MSEEDDFQAFAATLTATPEPAPAAEPEKPAEPAPAEEKQPESPPADTPPTEAPKPEQPKTDDKAPEPPKVDWKEAAAKERAARIARGQARQAAAQREAEFAAAKAKADRWDELERLAKEDELAAIDKLGLPIDRLNNKYVERLDKQPDLPTPSQKAEADRIARLEAEQKALKDELAKRDADALKSRQAAAAAEVRREIAAILKEKPDEFDALNRHPKGQEIVVNLLVAHYRESGGEELPYSEACRMAEAYLEDELKPFAGSKVLSSAPKTTTLSSDMRQSEPRQAQGSDENKEFLDLGLRLLKQTA